MFLKKLFPSRKLFKQLSQVCGLGMQKRFELETEAIIFTITLLGNK